MLDSSPTYSYLQAKNRLIKLPTNIPEPIATNCGLQTCPAPRKMSAHVSHTQLSEEMNA